MFGIDTPGKFLAKAQRNCARLRDDISDPEAALDAVLTLHHLPEWIWARWLKNDLIAQQELGVRSLKDFWSLVFAECPSATLIQELANGAKHCAPVHSTEKVDGYGQGPYGIGPFGMPYLLVDNGETISTATDRYKIASSEVFSVEEYWIRFCTRWGLLESSMN